MKSGEFKKISAVKRRFSAICIALLLPCILLTALPAVSLAESDEADTVRVSLSVGDCSELTVQIEGSYRCGDHSFVGGTLTAHAENGGVRLTHSELGELDRADSVTVLRQEETVWAAFLTLENTRYGSCRYLGDMIFANDGNDRLTVINRVGMRAYLYGVVGGELRNTHPIEALKAQAVAAKCFAMTCLDPTEPFDVDDTPTDQVYKGYHPAHENVIAAVDAVADDLLLYEGDVVRCYYCTSNGGQTITPIMRWGNNSEQSEVFSLQYDTYDLEGADDAVTLRVLPDARQLTSELHNLLLRLARDTDPDAVEIETVLRFEGIHDRSDPDGSFDAPAALASQEWIEVALVLNCTDGSTCTAEFGFSFDLLQTDHVLFAPNANTHYIRPEDDGSWTIIFSRSIGHRVGMSHYGMLQCAKLGFTYDEILYYYYPGADLVHGAAAVSAAPAQLTAIPAVAEPEPAQAFEGNALPTPTPEPVFIPYEEEPGFWAKLFGLAD